MAVLNALVGLRKLSQLQIDADKDWNLKGITNLKEVAAGMGIGDIVQHDGIMLIRYPPGTATYVLTSRGPGHTVVWAPGGTYFERFFPVEIDLAVLAEIFTPDRSKALDAPLVVPYGHDYGAGVHPEWFRRQTPVISLSKALVGNYVPDHSASKTPTIATYRTVELPVGGAVADDGGAQTDETSAAKSLPAIDQSYTSGDDTQKTLGASTWEAQTFTMTATHAVRYVKLKLYKAGSPGTVTVSIRATDGSGHPTGGDLCVGTIDGNYITEASPGQWYRIDFPSPATLSNGIKYAIVVRAAAGNLYWRADGSSPAYAGGNREYSTNSGTSWTTDAAADFMFEEFGSTNDMTLFPAAIAVGDAYYFGSPYKFGILVVDIGQVGAGTYTVAWEYSRAADFAACVDLVDGSDAFKNQWTREVSHTPQGDWVTATIMGMNLYWVRARCTDAGAGYTQPLGTFAKAKVLA